MDMIRRIWIYGLALPVVMLAAGCGPTGDLMTQHPQTVALHEGAVIAPAGRWRAGSAMMSNPTNAIDGKTGTYAVANDPSTGSITIDLSKPCSFNSIRILHGSAEHAYGAEIALLTSLDGRQFSRRHVQQGQRKVTNICLIKPILARYIRLQVIRPGPEAWKIAEIDVR